ncbi:response regulator transcription factor [Tenuibacillus multivorans]|nr:response regulator transcription factor [Tenuibacillus multivorans]
MFLCQKEQLKLISELNKVEEREGESVTNCTILIIEDDDDIHRMLVNLLHKNGYHTESAFSGTEALRLFETHSFDFVLLDLMLPGLPGEDVLQKIRAVSTVPIIVLTAKKDKETTVRLLKLGADDYIVKPFYPNELLARIEVRFRQTEPAHYKDKLSYKDIQLDLDKHIVTVNGTQLSLTRREFLILELLVRHPYKVFSKANIYESVWGDEFFGDDNTVNVHISKLRNKLAQASPGSEYIQTVWGVGFKLAEDI